MKPEYRVVAPKIAVGAIPAQEPQSDFAGR